MSIFTPRTFITGDNYTDAPSFHPLFRLLEDFDSYSSRGDSGAPTSSASGQLAKIFKPKFDVREIQNGYEVHGELPGMEQKDVEIEFTDSQTLNIRGKVEREYSSEPSDHAKKIESHQPTVEDANEASDGKIAESTAVEQSKKEGKKQVKKHDHAPKYWVSERSVGSFSRDFTFSQSIDHDNVKASMKNGLLSIHVPKKKAEARKVRIS